MVRALVLQTRGSGFKSLVAYQFELLLNAQGAKGMGNRKAVETLGMPHGTAANRLRKMLLFRQLKKHNENVCVRCSEEIETVDELSVEHIKPWEGISAELFWDLDNVAFSHMKCNRPHVRRGGIGKKGPEGTAWCTSCSQFLPIKNFYVSPNRWSGYSNQCKRCFSNDRKGYPSRQSLVQDDGS